MIRIILIWIGLWLFFPSIGITQTAGSPFQLELQSHPINGMPALHSYSFATWQGKWLLMGGRTNGLHSFQPPFAFPTANQNSRIYVIDPASGQVWSDTVSSLASSVRDHITSSNQQFCQVNDKLIITGGYGYSLAAAGMITFPQITVVDIPTLILSVQNQQNISGAFAFVSDQRMAVTGGHMFYADSCYYLVFGHRFDGRYNPHNGPSFTQTYTNAIRSFRLQDSSGSLTVSQFNEFTDSLNFHRRDYNLVPQIYPGGIQGYTGLTGVFQYTADLPWLNSVDIVNGNAVVNNNFQQLLNQYHTASFTLYDSITELCHSVFFGGISQYYPDVNGQLILDSLVPFVKTISYLERGPSSVQEGWLNIQMPGYLGSSAEFIPSDLPSYPNGVIRKHDLDTGDILLGYIVGGIESSQPNIFMQASGNSWASPNVYKVILKGNMLSSLSALSGEGYHAFRLYPNPSTGSSTLGFDIKSSEALSFAVIDAAGRTSWKSRPQVFGSGQQSIRFDFSRLEAGTYSLLVYRQGSPTVILSFIRKQ